MGSITHPDEPWAVDFNVRRGIDAHLVVSHCEEELKRISREARQAVGWAFKKASDLDGMLKLLKNDIPRENPEYIEGQQFITNLCTNSNIPRSAVESIYSNLAKRHCQIWMDWSSHCSQLLQWSEKYVDPPNQNEQNIRQQWNWIISNCRPTSEKLVIGQSVFMEFENQDELLEEELLEQEERQVFHPLQIDLTI
ncbi:hypothetical protein PSTT_14705 [Puccinia striiformis]|uniref:Uncharacterized protein n=1 Tax=Puccinia striiformis TaxID=27350 RepID=A0A2S4UL48_9BASI|nr:hypothetical protein PSTT_14705 [Puccinia striiformis]